MTRELFRKKNSYYFLNTYNNNNHEFLPYHNHDSGEIVLVDSGEGYQNIRDRKSKISRGDLIYLAPYRDYHNFEDYSIDFNILCLAIAPSFWEHIENRYLLNSDMNKDINIVKLTVQERQWLSSEMKSVYKKDISILDLDIFLLKVLKIFYLTQNRTIKEIPDWLNIACQEILKRENFIHGQSKFFELCGRSPGYTSRILKECTGLTTTKVVNNARLLYAAECIKNTTIPIIEICYDCGYESLSYFYKVFKSKYSMTPFQYKKSGKSL